MAITRLATGHSAPRKPALLPPPFKSKPAKKPPTSTTTKSTSGGAAANTSKPRAARVGKKRTGTAATTSAGPGLKRQPRKTGVRDQVAGLLEKAIGTVEGRPGKKAAGTKRMRGTDGRRGPR